MKLVDELLFTFDFGLTMNTNMRIFFSTDGFFDVWLNGTPDKTILSLTILHSELLNDAFEHIILLLWMKK